MHRELTQNSKILAKYQDYLPNLPMVQTDIDTM